MSVFVDESGLNLGMTRLYGRAERGERLYDSCPRNLWKKHIVNRGVEFGRTHCHHSSIRAVLTPMFL